MSLLYKPKEEQVTTAHINVSHDGQTVYIDFFANCGKFGTEEYLAVFKITAKRLLQILSEREDLTDEEL